MKIVLKKNHHQGGVLHLAGETIDVPQADYDYIMASYISERGAEVISEAKAQQKLADIGLLTPQQEKEAKAIGKKA